MTSPLSAAPPRPSALPPLPSNVPPAMTAFDHFLLWDWELREGRDGPIWTKPPLKVTGKGHAKSTDAAGWGSFRTVVNAYRLRNLPGFGFALAADDPFCFGDLDDCRNPNTGEIAEWARPILAMFRKTYQEISPSGTGIKIIPQGKLPGTEHRWRLDRTNPLAYVEWFDSGKYTTLTGHRLDDAGTDAVDCQVEIDALYRACFAATSERTEPTTREAPPVNLDDDAILQKARSSRDGPKFIQLFDSGNTSLYNNDDSAADIALCGMLAFWFGNDPDRIDRVFRRSALMRDKWADRADYRKVTIDKVLSGRTDFYTPRAPRRLTVVDPEAAPVATRRTHWTAAELQQADFPEPNWAVPDLIPEGLTILAGRPKKGKSRLALTIAVAVATGVPALGHFEIDGGGDVIFYGLEDSGRRLQDRLSDMLGARAWPPTLSLDIALPKLGDGAEVALERWLTEAKRPRLIVLDTYQRIRKPIGPRDGNAYTVDYDEAAGLQAIAIRYGVAVLLIHHTRKPIGGGDPFDDVLGSTGNTAAADALLLLQTERGTGGAKLLVVGRDIEEAEHALDCDDITGSWRRVGDAADVRRSAQRQAIMAALRASGTQPLKPIEIATYTKQSRANVRQLLVKMRNAGEVTLVNGAYVCTDSTIADHRGNRDTRSHDHSSESVISAPIVIAASPVTPVIGSWRCGCGADVVGHLAHCPVCGQRRSE